MLSEARVVEPSSRSRAFLYALVGASSILFFFMGLLGSSLTGFWRDEATSVGLARRSLNGVIEVILNREANMALYYILLHFWMQVGGDGVVWVRALSLIFAVMTVPALAWVAHQLAGPRVAGLSAVLSVGSAVLLRNAAEARAYSMAIFFAVCTIGLLLFAARRNSHVALAGSILTATAMVYSQILSVLLVLAIAASLLLARQQLFSIRKAVASTSAFFVLIGPLLWFGLARDRGQASWIPKTGLGSFKGFALSFGGTLLVAIILTVVAIISVGRCLKRPQSRTALVIILCWLVVPPLMLFVLSLAKPLFIPRYVAVSAPALVILVALAISTVPSRWRNLVLGIVFVTTVSGAFSTLVHHRADDVSAAAEFVQSHALPSDVIVYDPASTRGSAGVLVPGNVSDIALADGGSPSDQGDTWGVEASAPEVSSRMKAQKRIWLMSYPDANWDQTAEPVREVRSYSLPPRLLIRETFGELVVELYG